MADDSAAGDTRREGVGVDLAVDAGEPRWRAAGFLHGFAGLHDLPDLVRERAAPLKVRAVRAQASACWQMAPVCGELGIRQIAMISCDWGFGVYHPHPGDGGEWKAWEMLIDKVVQERREAGAPVIWDIWNEPDYAHYWRRSPEQFLAAWRRAFRQLRRLDPEMPIAGPQWSGEMNIRGELFERFLRYAAEEDVLPDYFDWHFPKDIVQEAEFCRQLFARLGIRFQGLFASEYCDEHQFHCGRMAFEIAQVERAGIDQAILASWRVPFGGLFSDLQAGTPRGAWWVYRRYAQMSGRLAGTTPSQHVELVASADPAARCVRILLGHRGGPGVTVALRVEGLQAAPWLAPEQRLRARVERIPQAGAAPVPAPLAVAATVQAAGDDALQITFPWQSDQDAYAVSLGNAE